MPTAVGPNTKGEENLVFGYDLGDTDNSYKGEPATNLITSGLPGYFGSGGETLYQERLHGLKSDSGIFQRNFVTNPSTGNNGGLYKAFTTSALSSTTRYIQISFDFYLVTRYRTASSSTVGLNGYLRIQNTDGLYDNYGWDTRYSNGSGDDWNNDVQYEGKWQKVSLIAALRGDKTPSSINAMYIYYDFFTQGEGIFTNFIITEHAALPTGPVRYTAGTRSATQGLLDLTSNLTIDLTNVSFDSNAQMTFDGTDDKAVVSNFPHIWDGSVSLETVVSWNDNTRSIIFGNYNVGANDINFEKLTSANLRFYWNRGERDIVTANNVVTTSGAYHHVTFIRDKGSDSFKFYVDGEIVGTVSNVGTDVTSTGSTFRIGGDSRNGDTIHNGDIPMLKIYNRALTASEIKSNFNAIKGRFNI